MCLKVGHPTSQSGECCVGFPSKPPKGVPLKQTHPNASLGSLLMEEAPHKDLVQALVWRGANTSSFKTPLKQGYVQKRPTLGSGVALVLVQKVRWLSPKRLLRSTCPGLTSKSPEFETRNPAGLKLCNNPYRNEVKVQSSKGEETSFCPLTLLHLAP